jgi:RloB-like protein
MPRKTQSIKQTDQKGDKAWLRKSKPYSYAVNSRIKNKTFLIVCEGQTEELYFKSFPVLTATIRSVKTGSSNMALINAVDRHRRAGSYDEVWCVFDFDRDPMVQGQAADFNRAIKAAKELGYHCAYSNDAFELWFVLHFQYLDQQQHRQFFYDALSERWGINYSREGKSLSFARTIYAKLSSDTIANQESAITRGQRLLAMHEGKPCHLQNPVTTVFQLVERLIEHCRK